MAAHPRCDIYDEFSHRKPHIDAVYHRIQVMIDAVCSPVLWRSIPFGWPYRPPPRIGNLRRHYFKLFNVVTLFEPSIFGGMYPTQPLCPRYLPHGLSPFGGTIWEDTSLGFLTFFLVWAVFLGVVPLVPQSFPPCPPVICAHGLIPTWGTIWGDTLDNSSYSSDIIFLHFSELFLWMDDCSHMGTCIYRGNQWPPPHFSSYQSSH